LSDAIFPSLSGRTLGIKKKPKFNTIVQTSITKIKKTICLAPYPVWTFTLGYAGLKDESLATDDLQEIVGFFLNRYGQYDSFLYLDEKDNTCVNQDFGEGDGSTTKFVLCRAWGRFIEPVNIASTPTIYIDGVATTAFSWITKGIITFATAPANGAVLSWSGLFYYRCRFTADDLEYEEVCDAVWSAPTVIFESEVGSS